MMPLAILLLFVGDPVKLSSELTGASARPGEEVRWVLRLEWDGGPSDVSLEELPEPRIENLRVVGVTRRSRVAYQGGVPVAVIEVGYVLMPLAPGWARIAQADVVCGVRGARQILHTEPVAFEVAGRSAAPSPVLRWIGGAGLVTMLFAGVALLRRRARRREVAVVHAGHAPSVDRIGIDELVRLGERLGLEIPAALAEANAAYKFARQPPEQGLLDGFRETIRAHLSAGTGADEGDGRR